LIQNRNRNKKEKEKKKQNISSRGLKQVKGKIGYAWLRLKRATYSLRYNGLCEEQNQKVKSLTRSNDRSGKSSRNKKLMCSVEDNGQTKQSK